MNAAEGVQHAVVTATTIGKRAQKARHLPVGVGTTWRIGPDGGTESESLGHRRCLTGVDSLASTHGRPLEEIFVHVTCLVKHVSLGPPITFPKVKHPTPGFLGPGHILGYHILGHTLLSTCRYIGSRQYGSVQCGP